MLGEVLKIGEPHLVHVEHEALHTTARACARRRAPVLVHGVDVEFCVHWMAFDLGDRDHTLVLDHFSRLQRELVRLPRSLALGLTAILDA